MAAAIAALHNKRAARQAKQVEEEDEKEEMILKLTSHIPEEKDIEGDLQLGMLMIDG
jgi:hypothetical protein